MRGADYKGVFGEAWELSIEPRTPAHYAAVYCALLFAPKAHPFWSWHLLSVVSLRDIVGVAPAKKKYPEAEHELSVFAIHPDTKPDPENPPYDLLLPPDVVEQFDGVDAGRARELGRLAALACVDGHLVPDSDGRSQWHEMVEKTVEHLRDGGHR